MQKIIRNRWMAFIASWLLISILAACVRDTAPTQSPTLTLPSTTTTIATKPSTPTATPTAKSTPILTKTATPVKSPIPSSCPGAPDFTLKLGDWAMVSLDPPLPNKVRSQPGSSNELVGQIQPGENVQVVEGPRCADGYAWWFVRSLAGLEGWTVEGDANGYWLVDPISAWYQLPEQLKSNGTKTYTFREINISADKAFVSGITGDYFPLATPLPSPQNIETPLPNDPRGNIQENQAVAHAAHSYYGMSSVIDAYLIVYDREDPLSRFYLNSMSYDDCTQALQKTLEKEEIVAAFLDPFCGIDVGIPLHFIADIRPIQFSGGKGVRFLLSSGNHLTVNKLYYVFEGLSDDGRYFIRGHFSPIIHPYIIDAEQLQNDFGPVLGWKEGQYDEAKASYDLFNTRIGELLDAEVVPLYPSLVYLDSMLASIVMK
jgi:hypothetical protein